MSSSSLHVLLVEDDDAYAAMIAMELEASGVGGGLTHATTLARALDAMASKRFDAVLLDLALPDSSGLDTLDRAHAAARGVPIIILTSHADDASAVLAVQRGAEDYLLKGDADGRFMVRAIRYARERAALRRQLTEREARFRALVEHSWDAIALVGPDYTALYNSRSVERILGYTADELQGKKMDLLAHPEDMPFINESFAECIAQPGRAIPIEYRYRHKDGSWRWGEGVIVNHLDDPAVGAIVVNHRDITERKLGEQELRASEDRLRQALKMEAVGQLAGGVAHDFNNVLTAIFGYSDLLRDQLPEGDPCRADLEEIRRSAERAAALTRQLLAFSRKQVMQPRIVDFNHIVTNVQKLLAKLLGDEIQLDVVLADRLWHAKADPGQLEQVLMNLAANARDAMPEGGRLTVATGNATMTPEAVADLPGLPAGDYVVLTVSDTGEGMPDSVRSRVFEPFFTTKELGKGTGLGLATVYGIMKQSEGGIYVESETGKGTRFSVYLPRVPE
jgi:two-component system cell cycle sensor histidine kinase/response regulator CckA